MQGVETRKGLLGTPLFQKSINLQGSWFKVILKWAIPAIINASCIFLSMWLLHVGTYEYVHRMLKEEHNVQELGEVNRFSALRDPFAKLFPKRDISIKRLDMVAGAFPMLFMLLVVLWDDLRAYSKVLFCNALLALLKGVLGAMTTMNDSSGWQNCQKRLTPQGVSYFNQTLTAWDLLETEAFGVEGRRFRWCADMMYSGHTYFTTLYALGLYELIRRHFRGKAVRCRTPALFLVTVAAVGEQLLEVWAVLSNRFHYSIDIFMAIVITLLVFSNGALAVAGKRWVSWRSRPTSKRVQLLESDGDILIPVCCFPFCCLAGREHVYTDEQVGKIVQEITKTAGDEYHQIMKDLEPRLSMGEGVLNPYLDIDKIDSDLAATSTGQSGLEEPLLQPDTKTDLQVLQGLWTRKGQGGSSELQVEGSQIIWNHNRRTVIQAKGSGKYTTVLNDVEYAAQLELKWNDGDVWIPLQK